MNILVIGNGFDLEHELPTKYEEFLEFAYLEISKYTKLHKIDWLIKKEL